MTVFLQTVMLNNYPRAYLEPYRTPVMKPSVKIIFAKKAPSLMFDRPKTSLLSRSITCVQINSTK